MVVAFTADCRCHRRGPFCHCPTEFPHHSAVHRAVLLAALAAPVSIGLRKLRFPRWLATLTTIIVFVGAVGGLVYLVINEVVRGWESLQARTILAYDDFVQYLLDSPLQVTETQLNEWVTTIATEFNIDSSWVLSGALSVTSSVGSWLVGAGIAIFALVFFIHDGTRIWEYVVSWFPKLARPAILGASRSGWSTLIEFVKVQILVAFVDALGIGLGAFFLGSTACRSDCGCCLLGRVRSQLWVEQ